MAWPAGYILCAYGQFALRRSDWARARLLLDSGLQLFSRLRDARGVARACLFLAQTALHQQDYTTALAMALRCLKNAEAVGALATMIGCLEELADAAVRRGKAGLGGPIMGRRSAPARSGGPPAAPGRAGRARPVAGKPPATPWARMASPAAWDMGRATSPGAALIGRASGEQRAGAPGTGRQSCPRA